MKSLIQVLRPFSQSARAVSGAPTLDKEKLKRSLTQARGRNLVWLTTTAVALAFLLIVQIVLALAAETPHPFLITTGCVGTGCLVAWLIWWWSEKSRMDVVLSTIDVLDSQSLQIFVAGLSAKQHVSAAAAGSDHGTDASTSLIRPFLRGVGSVLEFFPAPGRFDAWRITETVPMHEWPATVRKNLGEFSENKA